jgi:hypothetical protein
VQLNFQIPSRWRSAVTSSAASAATLIACIMVSGTTPAPVRLTYLLIGSMLFFALLSFTLVLGGYKGLLILWFFTITFWLALVYAEVDAAGWMLARVVRMLPDVFVVWSLPAIPLALGTELFIQGANGKERPPPSFIVLISSAWLILFAASSYLARHALDVGPNPRDQPVSVIVCVLLMPFALFVASLCISRTLSAMRGTRGTDV